MFSSNITVKFSSFVFSSIKFKLFVKIIELISPLSFGVYLFHPWILDKYYLRKIFRLKNQNYVSSTGINLSLNKARENASYYDENTRRVKEIALMEYEGVSFNSETYDNLMDIIRCCVKYNIIHQARQES